MSDNSDPLMTGAEAMVATLEACGVDHVFTNPGTSEMHAVAAIGRAMRLKASLCLFEGVATGAADGYARVAGKPAATLLHLGAGLGNGIANLHNARRARSPVINIVGDHAVPHRALDAPLGSDIAGLARPVSRWVASADTPEDVGRLTAEAVAQSQAGEPGVATLILPADTAWLPSEAGPAKAVAPPPRGSTDAERVEAAAQALAAGEACAILAGGEALHGEALELLGGIAAKSSARLYCDTFVSRWARGAGTPFVRRLPYFAEMAEQELAGITRLIVVATKPPVAFFAYPGRKGDLTPEGAEVVHLARPDEDALAALRLLAERTGTAEPHRSPAAVPPKADSALDQMKAGAILARMLPEGAVVSEDAGTNGLGAFIHTAGAARHDWLCLMGGAIGQGIPVALGAAVAKPDAKVVCLTGDGGAMYTIQGLWTAARDKLDVVTIVFANRSYAILKIEMMRTGAQNPGPKALDLFDLARPEIDFAGLARSMGIEAARCETAEAFERALTEAMGRKGPYLIEAVVA